MRTPDCSLFSRRLLPFVTLRYLRFAWVFCSLRVAERVACVVPLRVGSFLFVTLFVPDCSCWVLFLLRCVPAVRSSGACGAFVAFNRFRLIRSDFRLFLIRLFVAVVLRFFLPVYVADILRVV